MSWSAVTVVGAIVVGLPFASFAAEAEPLVYFRSDYGHARGTGPVPIDFAAAQNLAWRTPLAPGHSSPCLMGGQIYLTTFQQDESRLSTIALDASTGQLLWEQAAPASKIEAYHPTGSPAAATVACDGQRVYAFFGSYGLLCYTVEGAPAWSQSMGPFQDEFGSASSPIVAGELLILNQDHDRGNALFAFNRRTGEQVWRTPRDEFTRSYSTPLIAEIDGEKQIIVAGALTLTGYSAATGERRWWLHGLARIVNPTPILEGDTLYVATWAPGGDPVERLAMEPWQQAVARYDDDKDGRIQRHELSDPEVLTRFFRIDIDQDGGINGSEWEKQAAVFENAKNSIMAVRLGGRGELLADRVLWTYDKGVPYVASPLYEQGMIFLVKDGGILTSLDAASGKVLKQGRLPGRGNYYASPVAADGKIYLASESGVMSVVSAADQWQLIASHDFAESIYATPVINGGRLYLRTNAALYCFHQAP